MRETLPILLVTIAALLIGCSDSPEAPTQGLPPGTIEYELAWDTEGMTLGDEGWSTTSDLGFEIQIERGYLVSYSTQVVDCVPNEGIFGQRLWRAVRGLFETPKAWAGHDSTPNPAAASVSRVESLTDLVPSTIPITTPSPTSWCMVHYLVGRADDDTLDLPPDADMDRVSLLLEGTWRAPNGEPVPFEVQTGLATGVLVSLFPEGGFGDESQAMVIDGTRSGFKVRVVRKPADLFDGVDFETIDAVDVERDILSNIADTTRITARP